MPQRGDVHVVPGDQGWKVEVEGEGRSRAKHATQSEAWRSARQIAKKNQSEALLHGRDGQIRQRNTYGADPSRSRG